MVSKTARTTNRLLTILLLAAVLVIMGRAPLAYAGLSLCRSDPIVTLSNGDVLTLYTDIESRLANVESVNYFLHVPPGVNVVEVVHPDPLTAAVEQFSYAADGEIKEYSATTTVKLLDGSTTTAVTAYMEVVTGAKLKFKSIDTVGLSLQPLPIALKIKK